MRWLDMVVFKDFFANFIDNCDGVKVYFVNDANEIKDSDIDNNALENFRENFCKSLRTKYTESDNFSLIKLSNYDERDNSLFQYDFDEADKPFEFGLTEQALKFDITKPVDLYKVKNNKLNNIKSSIVVLTSSKSDFSIAFFQHVFPVSLLGPDKGLLNLTTHKTRVVKLECDVLKINANFVFMQIKDEFFIENVKVFENSLHFKKVIHSRAKNYAEKIVALGLIEDPTKFNERIDVETAFARKVVKAYKNSIVIREKIPNKDIVEFVENREYYSSHLKAADGRLSFKLDSISKCKKFLELLDDDFLKSELTNRHYLARSKDLVNA